MRDAVGQKIAVGLVCVHTFRVSSSIYHDLLLVTGFTASGVVGTKIDHEWKDGERRPVLRKSRPINPCNLVVTTMSKEQFEATYS